MSLIRLQKIIAASGSYSRRGAEELICQGKVRVNGQKITELGTKVNPATQDIRVRGEKINVPVCFISLLFHKPRECMVTRDDPEGRKTIYDFLPRQFKHLKPVGRLDYHSEGLLLLTNHGELAHRLAHPRFHLQKTYEVKVQPKPAARQLQRIEEGVWLDGRRTLPTQVKVISENPKSAWLEMILEEGRNRQIRRMCEKVGLTVKTLVRTTMGPFRLKGIQRGKYQLIPTEVMEQIFHFLTENQSRFYGCS